MLKNGYDDNFYVCVVYHNKKIGEKNVMFLCRLQKSSYHFTGNSYARLWKLSKFTCSHVVSEFKSFDSLLIF